MDANVTEIPLVSRRTQKAWALLVRAYRHAVDTHCDPWQFAIGVDELKSLGLHNIDLSWLLHKRFAEQAVETTIPSDSERCFRQLSTRIVDNHSFYTLTTEGFAALTRLTMRRLKTDHHSPSNVDHATPPVAQQPGVSHAEQLPVWDESQRELRLGGQLVKRYRVPAPNQERILAAFQEEGWPHGIDDPLPPEEDQDPIRRLQATIKSLNRNQVNPLVHFRGNGNGDRVVWDVAKRHDTVAT